MRSVYSNFEIDILIGSWVTVALKGPTVWSLCIVYVVVFHVLKFFACMDSKILIIVSMYIWNVNL